MCQNVDPAGRHELTSNTSLRPYAVFFEFPPAALQRADDNELKVNSYGAGHRSLASHLSQRRNNYTHSPDIKVRWFLRRLYVGIDNEVIRSVLAKRYYGSCRRHRRNAIGLKVTKYRVAQKSN